MSSLAVAGAMVVAVVAGGPLLGPTPRGRRQVRRPDPLRRMGESARRRVGPRLPSLDVVDDRAIGAVVLVAVPVVVVAPPLALLPPLLLGGLAVGRARSQRLLHRRQLDRGIVQLVDLLALAIAGGLPLRRAFASIAPRLPVEHQTLVDRLLARADRGESFVVALDWYGAHLGPVGHEFVRVLISSERDGAPLAAGLERAADATRRAQRRELERRARRLPVTMLLPLVFCVLPAFIVLTLVPLLVGTLGDLQFPG